MPTIARTSNARRGPLMVSVGIVAAIVGASAVNSVLSVIARAVTDKPDNFGPLDPGAYIFLTAVGVIAGAFGWGVVRSTSKNPAALLRWLVPAVVVASFIPDFFLLEEGGVVGVAALLLMHVTVAVVAVPTYRVVMPLTTVVDHTPMS